MASLFEFSSVALDKDNTLSFSIVSGDLLVLKAHTQETRSVIIDMALGEMIPEKGKVLFSGRPLAESKPGSIGWIPAKGGMISNLKAWENITLPLWYHGTRQAAVVEEKIAHLLSELKMDKQEWERFMASPGARLTPLERKLVGLLRGLVLAPRLLLIDADIFEDVESSQIQVWVNILEKFVRDVEGRAVLVVTATATPLHWKLIE